MAGSGGRFSPVVTGQRGHLPTLADRAVAARSFSCCNGARQFFHRRGSVTSTTVLIQPVFSAVESASGAARTPSPETLAVLAHEHRLS